MDKQTFTTPEVICMSCQIPFDDLNEKLGQKWHIAHWNEGHVTPNFLFVSGWVTLPHRLVWEMCQWQWFLFHAQHVCSSLVRWASPNIIPASCFTYHFKLLWNTRITVIWGMSGAMLIWLCSSKPLTLCWVPCQGLLWFCCGLGCVSSRVFSEGKDVLTILLF